MIRRYATMRHFVPPNLGGSIPLQDNKDLHRIISMYRNLPKGEPVQDLSLRTSGLWYNYYNKHFRQGKETFTPVIHLFVGVLVAGYLVHYEAHYRHHPNKPHH